MVLSDHLASCESNGIDYNTPWYKWCIERLQQIFLIVSSHKVYIILILLIKQNNIFFSLDMIKNLAHLSFFVHFTRYSSRTIFGYRTSF